MTTLTVWKSQDAGAPDEVLDGKLPHTYLSIEQENTLREALAEG